LAIAVVEQARPFRCYKKRRHGPFPTRLVGCVRVYVKRWIVQDCALYTQFCAFGVHKAERGGKIAPRAVATDSDPFRIYAKLIRVFLRIFNDSIRFIQSLWERALGEDSGFFSNLLSSGTAVLFLTIVVSIGATIDIVVSVRNTWKGMRA